MAIMYPEPQICYIVLTSDRLMLQCELGRGQIKGEMGEEVMEGQRVIWK